MRNPRSSALTAALVIALLALWVPLAQAAARVVVPAGWWESSGAAPEAQRRAGRWHDALGLRMSQVVSAPDDDRFAETVAVFERSEPIPAKDFASEQRAVETLTGLVANVVGSEAPIASGMRETSSGHEVAWARWVIDDLAYECVLAPSAESASVIVIAVLADEVEEQRPTIDGLISNLEGVSEAMPEFSLRAWRIGALVAWIALAVLLHALMLIFVDREQDHRQAGMRAAGITALCVVALTGASIFLLGGRELAIVAAGSSVKGLAMWIGVSGLIVVGAHVLITLRLDRGVVQSAPSSGAYASGTWSASDIRSSISRSSGVRPRPEDLSARSSSWGGRPNPGGSATPVPPATSTPVPDAPPARIVIDEAEREPNSGA